MGQRERQRDCLRTSEEDGERVAGRLRLPVRKNKNKRVKERELFTSEKEGEGEGERWLE